MGAMPVDGGRRACLLAGLGLALPAARAATAWSPEGKWGASAGALDNRVQVGLEIEPSPAGLRAFLTVDLLNFFRMSLPGFKPDGDDRWTIPAFEMVLTRAADRLRVSGVLDDEIELSRVATVPRPPKPVSAPPAPAPLWRVGLGGPIYAPTAVYGDFGYVGNVDGVMTAVDLRDGQPVWSFAAGRAIHGEALATGDAVYFACDNGQLFKLDRATGKQTWRYALGDAGISRVLPNPLVFDYDHAAPRPTLADGTLYVGSADGSMHAVDAARGERRWRFQAEGKVRGSAAVRGDMLAFGTLGSRLYALDRATGAQRWRHETLGPVTGSPVFAGEHLIVGHRGSRLEALLPGQAQPLWSQPYWGSWVESSAVIDDGVGYIGSGDLFLVSAFHPGSGRNLWRTRVGGWVLQRPAVNERFVYVSVSGARRRPKHFLPQASGLMALERTSGRIAWHWTAPSLPGSFLHGVVAAPALAGPRIVVGALDGSLYAFPELNRR
jgi:outer membrane protein assembly factor BamB